MEVYAGTREANKQAIKNEILRLRVIHRYCSGIDVR